MAVKITKPVPHAIAPSAITGSASPDATDAQVDESHSRVVVVVLVVVVDVVVVVVVLVVVVVVVTDDTMEYELLTRLL
jgi:hypothetical protein